MSQAGNQAEPKIPVGERANPRNLRLPELRESVVLAREQAIVALQRSITAAALLDDSAAALLDDSNGDVRSALVQALETELAVLEKIDPAIITDAEAMLATEEQIKSISTWSHAGTKCTGGG